VDVTGDGRRGGQESAHDEQPDVASRDLGAHSGCLAWEAGVVGSGHGPHSYATIRQPDDCRRGLVIGMLSPVVR
jgi:hypothetical protein